jgi:transposase InsO family protein
VLTVIDSFTRECLTMKVAQSLPAAAVTDVLEEVIAVRRAPQTIEVDNASEFTSNHFDAWPYLRGIRIDFIRPEKPVENAFIESFNGRLRDECLNSHWFLVRGLGFELQRSASMESKECCSSKLKLKASACRPLPVARSASRWAQTGQRNHSRIEAL